jgi:hypothetical protein
LRDWTSKVGTRRWFGGIEQGGIWFNVENNLTRGRRSIGGRGGKHW